MGRWTVSGKDFDAESRLLLVPLKFGVLSIRNEEFIFQKTRAGGNNTNQECPKERQRVREVPPVQEAPRRVRDIGTRSNAKKMLSRGVEAVREGTPQSVSFDTLFQTGEKELSVKMNFFGEQDEKRENSW